MTQWYQYLVDRLRSLFLTEVGLDMEAQFLRREAERKADLMRQAKNYEEEGFDDIAKTLREQAGENSIERPLASVLPSMHHLEHHCTDSATIGAATEEAVENHPRQIDISTPTAKSKGANSCGRNKGKGQDAAGRIGADPGRIGRPGGDPPHVSQ